MAASRMATVLAVAALAASTMIGCFDPRRPGCAFSCAADQRCPEGYLCGDDGLCHRDDGEGTCDLPAQTDGSSDGLSDGSSDGGADAASDGPVESGAAAG